MRIILIIALFFVIQGRASAQLSVENVLRSEIMDNDFDNPQILKFYEMAYSITTPSRVVIAYQAVSEAFMARVAWNPYSKILHLKKSEEIFNRILQEDPHNLEIRFLRFATQAGIPGFLGFSRDMDADKRTIIEKLEQLDKNVIDDSLFNFIVNFLSSSKFCTAQDLALLEKSRKKRFG